MADRIQVTTWDVRDCTEILNRLLVGERPRFGALHEKIQKRREHYHNAPEANPKLPAPYTGKSEYQTDILRRTHIKHRARITENAPVFRVSPPKSTEQQKSLADQFEAVLNRIYDLVQERTGQNFQSLLSDGQDRDAYGVLHWLKADQILPRFPDPDLLDDLPDDSSDAKRYEPADTGYKETDASRLERDKHAKARAGAPWHIEVIDPKTFAFVEDISALNGLAIAVVSKSVGLLDYNDGLRTDGIYVSLNEADKRIMVGVERERPADTDPSASGAWGSMLTVANIWTRTECYELVRGVISGAHTPWELVKSFAHPYEMPPFSIAYGHRNQHPDPVFAYEPVLEGLYRIKPSYDYHMAMNEIIAQSIALPIWWIELESGKPSLDERGKPIVLSRDQIGAVTLPQGAKLVKGEFDLNPAFVQLTQLKQEELKDAAPAVGLSDVSATTQAWSILLQQQQASIEPKQVVLEQERAIRTMARNMALVMSKPADEGGFGQPVYVYAKEQNGKINSQTAIGIDPKDIPTLEVDVEINPRSAAEVISRTEHGLTLLEKRVITLPEFKKDYQGAQNPQNDTKDNIAWWSFVDYVQPGLIKQELGKKYAQFITIGPNGTFVGFDGMQRTPAQVLQQNGIMPSPVGPGALPAGMPLPQTGTQQPLGAAPPPLPTMNVPNNVPQSGLPGV